MVYFPPKWVPPLRTIPDDVPINRYMLEEQFGRYSVRDSNDPFTCGLSGKSYSFVEVAERVELLAAGLAKEFGWKPNQGSEYDKVVGVFSVNTIDFVPLAWATHRLDGIFSPANAQYSTAELTFQLKNSGAKCLFTCLPLLKTALEAAEKAGISRNRVYLLELPAQALGGAKHPAEFKTVNQLIQQGCSSPHVEKQKWTSGQAKRQTAYLCYSSGTSGLPKGVMISHRNVIANTTQIATYEKRGRDLFRPEGQTTPYRDIALGLLPLSHIYGLVVVAHAGSYRGDQTVILPKFEINSFLGAIEKFKISYMFLVPPIIINMLRYKSVCDKNDLSSVRTVFTGAAPLGRETADEVLQWHPDWIIKQGYGLTETATVVCSTAIDDVWLGSCGSLVPGVEARIVSPEGRDLGYNEPGELVVRSPSVVLGYLNNEEATKETFADGWMRTGDEAEIRVSPSGNEHVFIVDRIKELIKVKGLQVAPAELEAHILAHPAVADCAVIPVPDPAAGEVPKAFVVLSPNAGSDTASITRSIQKHVEEHKARHKWLKGGVEFIDTVPKSPSGKILRRLLRDKDREARKKQGARL